jgi:general secretion pathway protein D
MKISIESSSVLPTSVSTVDITTSKRTITTNVLIDDGGIVVLGGLISNTNTKSDSKIPLLGSIPIFGNLFKTRSAENTKENLMIFIRPKILRDATQAAYQTDSKYNFMREQETELNKSDHDIPLLPNKERAKLDPAPPLPPPNPQGAAIVSPDEKARRAKEQDELDAEVLKKLQSGKPGVVAPVTPPGSAPPYGSVETAPGPGAATHPDGEPPYATESPGVLMPQQSPPPPESAPPTPPQGSKQ